MALKTSKAALVKAISEMKEADYAKDPDLQDIYERLQSGRRQFGEIFEKNIKAVMQISSLDLTMQYQTEKIVDISRSVANATETIFGGSADSAGGRNNNQHEQLTGTIVKVSSDTNDVFEKIQEGQNELTTIRDLSGQTIDISLELQKDMDKLSNGLAKLAEEDPTFKVYTDQETGQTIIAGMGELHLDIIADRLKREFKVECQVGKPQVAYKETIRESVKAEGLFKRQSGGRGQYGHAIITLEPLEAGQGFEFESKIVGGVVPKEYIGPIENGIKEAMSNGVVAGYEMVDIKATLIDGSYHDVDSSEMAFKIAGSMAFKDACRKANAVLLEPMMKVEVEVPEEYMGDVIGDLNRRRGQINSMDDRMGLKIVNAFVPLAEMFGYSTDLRSATQGRGTYTMEFDHYGEVPSNVAKEIMEKRKG